MAPESQANPKACLFWPVDYDNNSEIKLPVIDSVKSLGPPMPPRLIKAPDDNLASVSWNAFPYTFWSINTGWRLSAVSLCKAMWGPLGVVSVYNTAEDMLLQFVRSVYSDTPPRLQRQD